MPTISYTPVGWNGSDSAPNAPETVRLEAAVQTAIDTVQADLDTAEADIVTLDGRVDAIDYGIVSVPLTAGGTASAYISVPTARTVTAIHYRRGSAGFAVGNFTGVVKNGAGTTMLNAASVDVSAASDTFQALTVTATGADLVLTAGTPVLVQLVSDSGGAGGGPLVIRLTYA